MATNTYRNADSSITIIIRRRPENVPIPYELRDLMTVEKWDYRIMQINILCAKYSKPLFERVWFVFAVLTCAVVPIALSYVIFNAIVPKALRDAFDRETGVSDAPPSNRFDGQADDPIESYIFDTRMITLGILIGLLIVLWTPFYIWKRIGYMKARALTTRWAAEDGSTGASFVPRWTIKTPGVWTINGIVTITTPPQKKPTLFSHDVYLPPYILQASQQASGAVWAQQQQVPYNPGGSLTGIPPPYFPPDTSENEMENNFGDEKRAQDFEEAKV